MSIALFSADHSLTTGQALVTRRVVESVLTGPDEAVEYVYRAGGGIGPAVSWFGAVARLWRDIARRRVKTLYLVCSRSNVGFLRDVPALLAARLGTRVVVHAHGSDIVALLGQRTVSSLAKWLYRPCVLIVPSNHLIEPLNCAQFAHIAVVENFPNARISGSLHGDIPVTRTLRVLWNSNIMASKGAFDTLAAVAELDAEGSAVHIDVLGAVLGDEELSEQEAQARLLALRDLASVTYHGRVDTEEASRLLAISDVVALPSRYSSECQPLTIVEAMCAGRALVVTDIPALRATVGDYPAEFVPVRSIGAIKNALKRLAAEKQTDPAAFAARGTAPAAAARARFSVKRFDAEMATILQGFVSP